MRISLCLSFVVIAAVAFNGQPVARGSESRIQATLARELKGWSARDLSTDGRYLVLLT